VGEKQDAQKGKVYCGQLMSGGKNSSNMFTTSLSPACWMEIQK